MNTEQMKVVEREVAALESLNDELKNWQGGASRNAVGRTIAGIENSLDGLRHLLDEADKEQKAEEGAIREYEKMRLAVASLRLLLDAAIEDRQKRRLALEVKGLIDTDGGPSVLFDFLVDK